MNEDNYLIVDIETTVKSVIGQLKEFEVDQIPFAMAGALFNVALDAKMDMSKELFNKFTIRTGKFGGRKPWAERALFVLPEKTRDIREEMKTGTAKITVGTRSKVVGRMLTDGGVRRRNDGEDFAVPILGGGRMNKRTVIVPERIGKTGKLRKGNTAQDVASRDGSFFLPLKNGNGRILMMRKGKKLRGMFYMKPTVTIKPWWNLRDILAKSMEANLPRRFVESFNKAMESRRPR